MIDKAEDALFWVFTTTVGTIGSGVFWLIRRVFTNQKQIELLSAELDSREKHREEQRKEDRERMSKVESGIERIEGFLMKGSSN